MFIIFLWYMYFQSIIYIYSFVYLLFIYSFIAMLPFYILPQIFLFHCHVWPSISTRILLVVLLGQRWFSGSVGMDGGGHLVACIGIYHPWWNDSDLELHWAGQASALAMKGWGSNWVFLKFLLTLYVLCFSEGTKTYIYILCHSSTLTWHR